MGTSPESNKSLRNGILDKIENFLTVNYGKKEDLREFDKELRGEYYAEFMDVRHRWEKVYLGILEANQSTLSGDSKKVMQTIDRLAASVNRADYGYAPLLDRVQKIQEQELGKMLEYDKALGGNLIQINRDVDSAEAMLENTAWSQLKAGIDALKKSLSVFDEAWRKRKQVFS